MLYHDSPGSHSAQDSFTNKSGTPCDIPKPASLVINGKDQLQT